MSVDTNSPDIVAVEASSTSHNVGVDPLSDFLLDEGSVTSPCLWASLLLELWTPPQQTILFPVSLSSPLAYSLLSHDVTDDGCSSVAHYHVLGGHDGCRVCKRDCKSLSR
jgi:hypothetical protein